MKSEIEEKKGNIKKEIEKLKYELKIELPKNIAKARSYGDLKENAEYHAARDRQGFVKAKIAQLTEQLSILNNLDLTKIKRDKIGYGSKITLIDRDSGDSLKLNIVSSQEANPSEGKISLESPIGVALNNRSAGEEVEVNIPVGKKTFYIEKLITIHGNTYEGGNSGVD